MAHLPKSYCLRLPRAHHLTVVLHAYLRIGDLCQFVAQIGHPRPTVPLGQYLLDIVVTVVGIFLTIGDRLITKNHQFAHFGQIGILADQFLDFLFLLKAEILGCHHTGRTTVTRLLIIVIEVIVFAQLIAHDVQQVVVEDVCIDAFDNHRTVVIVLHLRQFVTEFRRQIGLLVS